MKYTGITIRGNILSYEKLEKIQLGETGFQSITDFGFDKSANLREEIGTAWSESKLLWGLFQKKTDTLPEKESGTSETRKLWMIPFLMQLGYDPESIKAQEIDGQSFAISHQDSKLEGFPILIMGFKDELDKKPEGARLRISPHALMQGYLNKTENVYGLVSNGKQLRLLRDSYRLAKLSFIEFDLEKIFEEELYFEFALLYRLLHCSRMPQTVDQAEKCPIETYHQDSLDSGARIRDQLRYKVKEAMELLANGFIAEHLNGTFTSAIQDKKLDPQQFYKFLLRIMYRIIFLCTIEERDLVFPRKNIKDPDFQDYLRKKSIYARFYSIERLRKLASSRIYINPAKHDLWRSLITTFKLFEPIGQGEKLGILPLGGDLFSLGGLQLDGYNIEELNCQNKTILSITENLTTFTDETGSKVRVNYRDLDVEELGSIYEALLELHPYFNTEVAKPLFGFSEGSQRKLTGSYYTRHDLVAQLIKTALYPVLDDRLAKAKTKEEKEKAVLSIKVCDPAAGSGHFLIAAAKSLGFELAKIRSDEENPGEHWVLDATRDVISQCIHGVDKNPDAVELCRISLWLTGHSSGKPLTFIDHKIKCGDSLVGVDSLDRLQKGIPDGAFKPVAWDDKSTASQIKKRNNDFLKKKQYSLFLTSQVKDHQHQFAQKYRELNQLKIDSPEDYTKAKSIYQKTHIDPIWKKDHTASNLFTWAFFQPYEENAKESDLVHSEFLFQYLNSSGSINAQLEGLANARAIEYRFFHWYLEFPDVFEKGGFDVIIGNPPWERIKLQEKEFFSEHDKQIADAPNAAARKRLINRLSSHNPSLLKLYKYALHESEANAKLIRESNRYPLTGNGDINTYSIFSELIKNFISQQGRAGFIVPTGIATDDTNKYYFGSLISQEYLISLFDFENRKAIFPSVHRSFKFSLLTLGRNEKNSKAKFGFFLHDILDLLDPNRVFELNKENLFNINPNTKTTPVFRTRQDAELTAKIYSRLPVIINEERNQNSWGLKFMRMFDMSNDSGLFKTSHELINMGGSINGNRFMLDDNLWLQLYESKMIWNYNHRFGSYEGVDSRTSTHMPTPNLDQYQNPEFIIKPWYWINCEYVDTRSDKKWFLGFRDITNNTNERTTIATVLPKSGVSNKLPNLFMTNCDVIQQCVNLCNLGSIVFDYIARQKIGGTSLNFFILKQFPIIPIEFGNSNQSLLVYTIELIYTSWDIKAFADDLWKEADDDLRQAIQKQWNENRQITGGHYWKIPDWADAYPEIEWERDKGCPLSPFKWDEDRRALLRAELDAYFALLYGLERDELRYILDPQDVYGDDFPGETFRVLKNKEIKKYGEYRTRRLVLEAYDRLRPDWDMEAHLAKLKEVWEKYQEDLSEKKKPIKQVTKQKPKPKKVEEPKEQYGMFGHETVQVAEKVTLGSRVKVRNLTQGKDLSLIIVQDSKNAQAELEYQPISITSAVALPMINAKVGFRFKVGENEFEIINVE